MGIFGDSGNKRRSDEIPKEMDDIRDMINSPSNVRMSQVRDSDSSDLPVWRQDNELPTMDSLTGMEDMPAMPARMPEPVQQTRQIEPPSAAPLFVKIDRYQNLISTVGYLKSSMKVVNNSFNMIKEIEKVREQTIAVIRDTIEKMDQTLASLDNELTRPAGFNINQPMERPQQRMQQPQQRRQEPVRPVSPETRHGIEGTIGELKSQIRQLKTELQRV